jgi:FtsZ-binding cell division protein ZapB
MAAGIDHLEQLVTAATERLAELRAEVARLEHAVPPAATDTAASALAEENRRLHEERDVVRRRIAELIGEIDRAL